MNAQAHGGNIACAKGDNAHSFKIETTLPMCMHAYVHACVQNTATGWLSDPVVEDAGLEVGRGLGQRRPALAPVLALPITVREPVRISARTHLHAHADATTNDHGHTRART